MTTKTNKETLEERLQRDAREKATIRENQIENNGELIDGSYAYFYLPELDALISHTIAETIKEAVRVIEGGKHLYAHTHQEGKCRVCIKNDALTTLLNQAGALAAIEEIKQVAPSLIIKSKGKKERIEYDFGVQEYLARIEALEAKIKEK